MQQPALRYDPARMDPLLVSTLLELAVPLATIAVVLVFVRRRGLLLLGAARATAGSPDVPVAIPALGNLFSIWQSTHA